MNGRPDPGVTNLVRDVVDGYLAEDDAMLGARDRAARLGVHAGVNCRPAGFAGAALGAPGPAPGRTEALRRSPADRHAHGWASCAELPPPEPAITAAETPGCASPAWARSHPPGQVSTHHPFGQVRADRPFLLASFARHAGHPAA